MADRIRTNALLLASAKATQLALIAELSALVEADAVTELQAVLGIDARPAGRLIILAYRLVQDQMLGYGPGEGSGPGDGSRPETAA